jgi:hypothetical protein
MTLASNRLVFSASSFLALPQFSSFSFDDSNRVPIQAIATNVRLFDNQLSMLKAKGPWRHARHLVEAPRQVTLVGESGCEGDVNERKLCVREQLLRTQ